MQKIIFLLLLAQAASCLYADEGCLGYTKVQGYQGVDNDPTDPLAWRWASKMPTHQKCYCNCEQYPRAHNKCLNCGHIHIPKQLVLSENQPHHAGKHKHHEEQKTRKKRNVQE